MSQPLCRFCKKKPPRKRRGSVGTHPIYCEDCSPKSWVLYMRRYMKRRRAARSLPSNYSCIRPACDRGIYALGLCESHYVTERRSKREDAILRLVGDAPCYARGCIDTSSQLRDRYPLCRKHAEIYDRSR